jgi:hypothetical protein
MKKTAGIVLLFSVLSFFPTLAFAAAAESKLNQLEIGMTPEKIISILGKPDFRRPEGVNSEGKSFERMQYSITKRLKEATDSGQLESTYTCSLAIVDGVLARIDRER